MPDEWQHKQILTEDRGVPREVLEGMLGSDGDLSVREMDWRRVHRKGSPLLQSRCHLHKVN